MLRFILKRETFYEVNQMRTTDNYTIDIDTPELEAKLTSGGFGESGYDQTSLVAVEVVVPNVEHNRRTAASSPGVRVDGSVMPQEE
jgi:hypothetical protein